MVGGVKGEGSGSGCGSESEVWAAWDPCCMSRPGALPCTDASVGATKLLWGVAPVGSPDPETRARFVPDLGGAGAAAAVAVGEQSPPSLSPSIASHLTVEKSMAANSHLDELEADEAAADKTFLSGRRWSLSGRSAGCLPIAISRSRATCRDVYLDARLADSRRISSANGTFGPAAFFRGGRVISGVEGFDRSRDRAPVKSMVCGSTQCPFLPN